MKRRLGSYFYKSQSRPEEIRTARWNLGSIAWRAIKKTCTVVGALILFSALMGLIAGSIVGGVKSDRSLPDKMVLVWNIVDPIGETVSARSFADPFAPAGSTVSELVAALDYASKDKRVSGLIVSLDKSGIELAHIEELRAAIKRFRDAGKFAYIFTTSFSDLGSGIGAYYFASAFEQIWMQPVGMLSITGISMEMPFARDTLNKLGANPEFLHREEYKSAMESFTNSSMSAPNREMMTSILNDITSRIFDNIREDRKLKGPVLQAQIDKGLLTGAEAVKAGLIDRLDYADNLLNEVEEKTFGEKDMKDPPLVAAEDYYAAAVAKKHHKGVADVALVQVVGEIVPGSDPEPGMATSDYIASAIHEATEDENIKVIVVRVDSPGGSPTASETIRRAIVHAKAKGKKILVSMGPLAASGGYWVSVDADKIFALPSTLTGSIGVIMGKFELSALWKKLGVNWDAISWGKNARMWSANAPLDADGRAAMNEAIDDTYNSFIERVATGRKMDKVKVREIAKGRAWTGSQAINIGLVDQLGGLDSTLDEAAKIVGVENRFKLKIIELPKPLSTIEQLMYMMGSQVKFNGLGDISIFNAVEPLVRRLQVMERMGPVQAYDPAMMTIKP